MLVFMWQIIFVKYNLRPRPPTPNGSSYRRKAGVPLFNATDRPQIQQLFACRLVCTKKMCQLKIVT